MATKRAGDPVRELVAKLPAGADRCVVARPALLSGARRALFTRVSQAESVAWRSELSVVAYASAYREYRDAAPGVVALLSFAAEPARVRAWLAARGPQYFDLGDAPRACDGNGCPFHVRFLDAHVLELTRGRFTPRSAAGSEARCARMAERSPDALELSFARSRALLSLGLGILPLTASSELSQSAIGLHVRRNDLMRSIADAERAANDPNAGDVVLGPVGAIGSNMRRQQLDAAVQTEYDLLWEDLELARDDEARMQTAELEADALDHAEPDPSAGDLPREDVLAELGYLLERLRNASADERGARANAARTLLEHALARNGDDEGLALLLTELLLTELGAVEPARELVQRFGSRPFAQARWAELRRHAAALTSVEALAAAMSADRLAPRAKARTLAGEILARLREGAPYAEAERAVLTAK